MKQLTQSGTRKQSAFTLIELLVVMAIIGVLAALTFPTVKGIKENATRKKVKTELHRLETVIESYKAKCGFYPPDNPGRPELNQLYFELEGTSLVGADYQTLDESSKIAANAVTTAFGPGVLGFANCSKGAGDDAVPAVNFLKGLKPGQYVEGTINGTVIRILTSSVQVPSSQPLPLPAFIPDPPEARPNPWRYNSSSPANNSSSYDLWVDIFIGGKTNRISNWSEQPRFVN